MTIIIKASDASEVTVRDIDNNILETLTGNEYFECEVDETTHSRIIAEVTNPIPPEPRTEVINLTANAVVGTIE